VYDAFEMRSRIKLRSCELKILAMSKIFRSPYFRPEQKVKFIGGEGIIREIKSDFNTWIYHVEMALGKEPIFGRIGAETTIVLHESELWG
jgi:hypothetical protein